MALDPFLRIIDGHKPDLQECMEQMLRELRVNVKYVSNWSTESTP